MKHPTRLARTSEQSVSHGHQDFQVAVIEGLSKLPKSLPCRFLYDARGSRLFEEITHLPEYYPTRTEVGILREHGASIIESMAANAVLVEFGSGSSTKTELLLTHLPPTVAYVPIDISPTALAEAKQRLTRRFPALDIYPIIGSFTEPIAMPTHLLQRPRVGFFPGSTIGNWTAADGVKLLRSFRSILKDGGRLIVGVDLKKAPRTLVRAYNDAAGITAAFNLNLLTRINRELGSRIDIGTFCHEAIYDPRHGRIEMHLVSGVEQTVAICGHRIHFRAGESVHTESSYKYTVEEFRAMSREAGWQPGRVWTDSAAQFSVHELLVPALSSIVDKN